MPDLERVNIVTGQAEQLVAPAGTYQMLSNIDRGYIGGGLSRRAVNIFEALGVENALTVHIRRRLNPNEMFPHKAYDFMILDSDVVRELEVRIIEAGIPSRFLNYGAHRLLSDALNEIDRARHQG